MATNGRQEGAAAEREAVRLLRAHGLRAFRVLRFRGETVDVDAVIFLGQGQALEVQIRRHAGAVQYADLAEVGAGRVLMYRENRGPWWVAYSSEGGQVPVSGFARLLAGFGVQA